MTAWSEHRRAENYKSKTDGHFIPSVLLFCTTEKNNFARGKKFKKAIDNFLKSDIIKQ